MAALEAVLGEEAGKESVLRVGELGDAVTLARAENGSAWVEQVAGATNESATGMTVTTANRPGREPGRRGRLRP